MKSFMCGLLLISGSLVLGQERFLIDKPQYNGMAKVLAHMNASGFLDSTELTSGFFLHFNPTRQAMASTIVKAAPRLHDYLRSEQQWPPQRDDELRNLHERRSLYAAGIYDTWSAMLREFAPEIKKQGANVALLRKQLDGCKPLLKCLADQFDRAILLRGGTSRFPDVPFDHWAEREIQELRDVGILNGYPDGRFRG